MSFVQYSSGSYKFLSNEGFQELENSMFQNKMPSLKHSIEMLTRNLSNNYNI